MIMEILALGNPHVKEDSLALEISERIKIDGVSFIRCTDVDDFMRYCEDKEEVTILDVADGIDDVTRFEGPDALKERQLFSLHDFDVGFAVQLLDKMGVLPRLHMIAVPKSADADSAIAKVSDLITSAL